MQDPKDDQKTDHTIPEAGREHEPSALERDAQAGASAEADPDPLKEVAHASAAPPVDDRYAISDESTRTVGGKAAKDEDPSGWERKVLEKLVLSVVRERRAARRWSIFFRLVSLALVGLVVWHLFGPDLAGKDVSQRHTALVSLDGEISADSMASAEAINSALQAAFEDSGSAGVILRINSPGGSPVQAGMINSEIRRLRGKHPDKPMYVVVEEVCASGGYFVAAAADKIYVDQASIVGSIGVLMDGFGFSGLMQKLGVERRLLTAGENKGMLDPFSPLDPGQRAHAQKLLSQIHAQFIKVVRDGRGERLKDSPEIFSGMIWSGEESIALGLADELGTVEGVARDVIKAESIIDYTVKPNVAERLARRFGTEIGAGAMRMLMGDGMMRPLR